MRRCWGFTEKLRRCRRRIDGRFYCDDHGPLPVFTWLIPITIAGFASWEASKANDLTREVLDRAAEERVLVQVTGAGTRDQDYETRFYVLEKEGALDHVLIETRWSVTISNIGENTVSLLSHNTRMVTDTSKRTVVTEFADSGDSYPVMIGPGEGRSLLLRVPMRVATNAYQLAVESDAFSEGFKLSEFETFLQRNDINILGKNIRRLRKPDGGIADDIGVYVISSNDEGHLEFEIRTARGNFFSGQSHYYERTRHSEPQTILLPYGEPATITFEPEEIEATVDRLPR